MDAIRGASDDEVDEGLIDSIYREKVLRARGQPPGEKIPDGPRLSATAAAWTKAGTRAQHPQDDEARLLEILRERIALSRRLEQPR